MPLTNDDRIRALVSELDEAVPRDGKVVVTGDLDAGATVVRADQLGYLRLGIEFLKAAHAAPRSEVLPDRVELDLSYLTGLDEHCYSFERREEVDATPPPRGTSSDGLGGLFGGALVLFIVASLVVGAFTILGWLSRAFSQMIGSA